MKKNIKMIAAAMMLCVLTMNTGVNEAYAFSYATNFTSDPELVPIYEQATAELGETGKVWFDKSNDSDADFITRIKYDCYFLGYISDTTTTYKQGGYSVSYNVSDGDIQMELQKHYAAKTKIQELSDQMAGMDNYAKVKWIHDWLCSNVEYDQAGLEAEEAGGPRCGRSAYDAIICGKSVCSGYAKAFFAMCSYEGIPVRFVSGTTSTGSKHSWNEVNIDGTWKKVDCTWDDQDYGIIYHYFMVDINYDNSLAI